MAAMFDTVQLEGWPEHFTTTFGCEPECEDVVFVFGAIAADTGSVFAATWPEDEDHLKLDRGHLEFDPAFSLQSPAAQVRKTPSWSRSWANFSLLQRYSHGNAWASLHFLGQPNNFARYSGGS
jgi:hypothetical protein